VVPVEVASDKQEFAARTIRPKIQRGWDEYLRELPQTAVKRKGKGVRNHLCAAPSGPFRQMVPDPFAFLGSDVDVEDVAALLGKLKIDRSVVASPRLIGGSREAHRLLDEFIERKLARYTEERGEPAGGGTSMLSAYLHFGQISPLEIALRVQAAKHAPAAGRDACLEQLIVRRELAINFVQYNPHYDSFDGLPAWAKQTLKQHGQDPRPYLYTRDELERATTHDDYWNAAQREMVLTGYMHNSLRMYWGKKILEWKKTPEEAFADTLYLNNKYFLCGRDPCAYANVGWIFGLHDRPWANRSIFGTVRYMNATGLDRKYDMAAYVEWVRGLEM
jgi:deoxyribodipyrimidine photo-lyase